MGMYFPQAPPSCACLCAFHGMITSLPPGTARLENACVMRVESRPVGPKRRAPPQVPRSGNRSSTPHPLDVVGRRLPEEAHEECVGDPMINTNDHARPPTLDHRVRIRNHDNAGGPPGWPQGSTPKWAWAPPSSACQICNGTCADLPMAPMHKADSGKVMATSWSCRYVICRQRLGRMRKPAQYPMTV